jgi:uncharacterized protein (DUF983 family)
MATGNLQTSVDTKNESTYIATSGEEQFQKKETYIDIEHEIECPRCYNTMTLLSDFDTLYYSCEECGFLLYTVKRGP